MDGAVELTLGGLSLCVIPTPALQAIRREAIAACALALADTTRPPAPAAGFHAAVVAACEQHLRVRAKARLAALLSGAPAPQPR